MKNRHARAAAALSMALSMLLGTPAAMAQGREGSQGAANASEQARAHAADRSAIRSAETPAEKTRGRARARVDHHLEERARAGKEVRTEDLTYVEIDTPDGDMGAVVHEQETVQHLERVEADGSTWIQAVVSNDIDVDEADAQGYDAASGTKATRRGRSCRSLFFEPNYDHYQDHYVYDCWEKWQSTANSRDWAYNRYTLFNSGDCKGCRNDMVDATIRTKPWRGYESRITGGPYRYAPLPTANCTTYTAEIGLEANGVGAKLSVPHTNCRPELEPQPNANTRSMGVIWTGHTQATQYLDASWDFEVSSSSTTPILADYVWMEVRSCYSWSACSSYNNPQYLSWRDSGW